MKIESIRLKNFKAFRDVRLDDIPALLVVVGANGSGKTTLFDVFGFLHDCLKGNVRQALDKRGRFREVLSRGCDPAKDSILIELKCRIKLTKSERLVTYSLEINESNGSPAVKHESLSYEDKRHQNRLLEILEYSNGSGYCFPSEGEFDESFDYSAEVSKNRCDVRKNTLAINVFGQLEYYKEVCALRQLIENCHVSNFHISAARGRKEAVGNFDHLSETGDNLPLIARNLYEKYPTIFQAILDTMARRIPGIARAEPVLMDDGYLTLRFQDGSFKTPFLDRYMSDGTIKMFAYLVLLHDPEPHPLLCVEEPENQLYPQLMAELAEEFRAYAGRGGQVMVSTHSPDFLNAMALDEVCWLVKRQGFTEIHRARDNVQVKAYMEDGDQLGYLWKQGFFEGVDL